jgi:hypothetical protein
MSLGGGAFTLIRPRVQPSYWSVGSVMYGLLTVIHVATNRTIPESGRRDLHPHQTESSALWLVSLFTDWLP